MKFSTRKLKVYYPYQYTDCENSADLWYWWCNG